MSDINNKKRIVFISKNKNNVTDDVKLSLEEKSRDICAKWEVRTCMYVWGL